MVTLLHIYLTVMNVKNFYGNKLKEMTIFFSDSPSDYTMTLTFEKQNDVIIRFFIPKSM